MHKDCLDSLSVSFIFDFLKERLGDKGENIGAFFIFSADKGGRPNIAGRREVETVLKTQNIPYITAIGGWRGEAGPEIEQSYIAGFQDYRKGEQFLFEMLKKYNQETGIILTPQMAYLVTPDGAEVLKWNCVEFTIRRCRNLVDENLASQRWPDGFTIIPGVIAFSFFASDDPQCKKKSENSESTEVTEALGSSTVYVAGVDVPKYGEAYDVTEISPDVLLLTFYKDEIKGRPTKFVVVDKNVGDAKAFDGKREAKAYAKRLAKLYDVKIDDLTF